MSVIGQIGLRCGGKQVSLSVLMRARGGHESGFESSLASLRRLRKHEWELCVALDPGAVAATRIAGERQTRVVHVPEDAGPAAAYQACLGQATGRFLLCLEPGEQLNPRTLVHAVGFLDSSPEVDLVYADEDRVTATGTHHTPFFRPGWSPDYFLAALYIDRAFLVRREPVAAVGGFRSEYDPVPEWDLLLRLSEPGRPFASIPELLIHRPGEVDTPWRPAHPALVAAGQRAIADACRRRGIIADVLPQGEPGTYRVRRASRAVRLVSVIVPFRDGAVLLRRCVQSVLSHCGKTPIEIILVDNGSVEEETRLLVDTLCSQPCVRLVSAPGPFNFAALVNRGAAAARGDVLCLLNSDVEAIGPGWLEALLEQTGRPKIGAVGAKLLYPDGSIQHAGVVLGGVGGAGNAHRFAPGDYAGYFANAAVVREVSAVAGACLATRREVFEGVGGFDEALPVAFNEVDFCLRVQERGYRVVYNPYAELLHHEGASRGRRDEPQEALAYLRRRWGERIASDPYYHPLLSPTAEYFRPILSPHSRRVSRVRQITKWLRRQIVRVGWLGQDLAAGLRGWLELLTESSHPAETTATIAFVAGAPVAVQGQPNRYWIRLVNTSERPREMSLEVRGQLKTREACEDFQLATVRTLGPDKTEDLTCETDWRGQCKLEVAALPIGCLVAGHEAGPCELNVTVRCGGTTARARLVQRVNQ